MAAFLVTIYLDKTPSMNVKAFLLSILILVFTSSCSGTYHAYYQTLKNVFSKPKDVQMTIVEIKESKIDVISVKRGDRPIVIMALAYLENGQHKWVSNDNIMLIIEKGRIIRTLGLNKNLLYTSNTDNDPLKLLQFKPETYLAKKTWSRSVDLTNDEYAYPIESKFTHVSQETLQVLNLDIEVTLYIEDINYRAPTHYFQLNDSWKNHYWYNKNGELIKSLQKISPGSEPLEITYLSRIARLNNLMVKNNE